MSRFKFDAVTFDAGGTLIEPWPSVGAVYAEVAREFGWDCSPETLTSQFVAGWKERSAFGYSREEWFEIVRSSFLGYGEVSPELFEAIYNRFSQPDAWLIYDDVIPTLQTLEDAGLKLAVISNWDERLLPLLERLGLATYFDEIVVSASLRAHKPDPKIFAHTAGRLQLPAARIFHVGDSESEDVAGARATGFSAARIRRSGVERPSDILSLTQISSLLSS